MAQLKSGSTVGGDNVLLDVEDSVGASNIADNAVTLAKMASGTDGELITYDASGDPAYVAVGTSGQVLTSGGTGVAPTFQTSTHTPDDNSVTLAKMAHGTDGELITYDATGAPANVAVGTSGQVLTSGGVGVAPTFQTAAGANTSLSNLSSTGEQRVCQAWVNFKGTGTVTIRDSHNVSSITDSGSGNYTMNFSTALPNANYSVVASCNHNPSGANGVTAHAPDTAAPATTYCDIRTIDGNNNIRVDSVYIMAQIFGD